ncbi:hypothetical protein Acr_00g0046800 [Actinidia rufa]|uniref:Uncharacterized protein n=1 Tax=Actinidia rufa TaxID=165716 RepID=A0A7J0DJN7_9ERIC|nr:hypothetical protein Acr_00g0046800 [Actinidia rufa]
MVRDGAAARDRRGGARMANLVDVYDRDNDGRDATTEDRVQLVEQQFERFEQLQETMLTQFAILQVGCQPHHHPRNHALEEEKVSDGEPAIPFANYQLRIDIPEFHEGLATKDFLDWVNAMEDILEFKEVFEEKQAPLMYQRLHNLEQRVIPNNCDSHWESGLKIDVSKFKGSLQPDEFLDWDSPPICDDYADNCDVFYDGCLFTSTTTSNLVVDLSKSSSFDEEPFIEQEPIEEKIYIEEETKMKDGEEMYLSKEMLQVDSFEDF